MEEATLEKIHELLKSFDSAMLVTSANEGTFHARPMDIAQVDPNCEVWFYTSRSSPKIEEIKEEQNVVLTFQKDHQKYLSVTGIANIITDRAHIESIWSEDFRVWFPDGVADENLVLVCITPQRAEFWDNSGSKGIRYLYEAAKAYLHGSTPDIKEGEQHGQVNLV